EDARADPQRVALQLVALVDGDRVLVAAEVLPQPHQLGADRVGGALPVLGAQRQLDLGVRACAAGRAGQTGTRTRGARARSRARPGDVVVRHDRAALDERVLHGGQALPVRAGEDRLQLGQTLALYHALGEADLAAGAADVAGDLAELSRRQLAGQHRGDADGGGTDGGLARAQQVHRVV